MEATFQGNANFGEATIKDANFRAATFKGNADFEGAKVEREFKFAPVKNQYLNFRNSQFFFRGSVTADLSGAEFHGSYLDNIAFIDCAWPQKIYEEVHMNDKDITLSFKELETIYRDLKQNMQRHGNYSKAGDFFYREMECKKRAMREKRFSPDWLKSYVYSYLKYTCGYGEKPERVILTSILIVFTAAFLFALNGVVIGEYTPEEHIINYNLSLSVPGIQAVKDFLQCLYYSVVTFTTLGYGDIHPIGLSKLVASAEAFTGAFFIALFVLVFGRKMMR